MECWRKCWNCRQLSGCGNNYTFNSFTPNLKYFLYQCLFGPEMEKYNFDIKTTFVKKKKDVTNVAKQHHMQIPSKYVCKNAAINLFLKLTINPHNLKLNFRT